MTTPKPPQFLIKGKPLKSEPDYKFSLKQHLKKGIAIHYTIMYGLGMRMYEYEDEYYSILTWYNNKTQLNEAEMLEFKEKPVEMALNYISNITYHKIGTQEELQRFVVELKHNRDIQTLKDRLPLITRYEYN